MTKHQPNRPLLFILIAAFFSMQWSATHIHLAKKHHDHDNIQHQHTIEAHAHQLNSNHTDNIANYIKSAPHHNDDIVELEHECCSQTSKKTTSTSADIVPVALLFSSSPTIRFELPDSLNNKPSHLDRSTVNPRAPPLYS